MSKQTPGSVRSTLPLFCTLRSDCRGFTLIELIVAMALVGLITLLLFSGLRLGARTWEGVEGALQKTGDLRAAREFLVRALSEAREVHSQSEDGQMLLFSGTEDALDFVAPLSEHVGTPGLYLLRLSINHESAPQLLLTRWLLHPDVLRGTDQVPRWEPLVDGSALTETLPRFTSDRGSIQSVYGATPILDQVAALQISYFGQSLDDEEARWHSQWLQQPKLPLALRIHLGTANNEWPDILVRLPRNQDSMTRPGRRAS